MVPLYNVCYILSMPNDCFYSKKKWLNVQLLLERNLVNCHIIVRKQRFVTKVLHGLLFDLFNPFTVKRGQRQISTKFPTFILLTFEK